MSLLYYGVYPIIIDVRKEVVQMDDKIWDLTIVVISVLLAKALDEGIEALKKKTSRKPGKHTKRSR